MDKICPLMSKRVPTKGAYDQDITEMYYENCAKENCAWWVSGYTTEKLPISCCALEKIAMNNGEGLYRV